MSKTDILNGYFAQLQQLRTVLLCEDLQAAAFRDYCCSNLSDAEYSAVYFAAEARRYEISNSKRKVKPA